MKKLFDILYAILSVIIAILGAAFVFIEGRLLFSGEFLLYANVAVGFLQYSLRFIIALTVLFIGALGLFKNRILPPLYAGIFTLAIGIGLSFFVTNGLNFAFLAVGVIYFATSLLKHKFNLTK
jgi:hypothetical protein